MLNDSQQYGLQIHRVTLACKYAKFGDFRNRLSVNGFNEIARTVVLPVIAINR